MTNSDVDFFFTINLGIVGSPKMNDVRVTGPIVTKLCGWLQNLLPQSQLAICPLLIIRVIVCASV